MTEVTGKAGRSSQKKYDDLTRAWRRRNRKLFIAVGGACGATAVGSYVASQKWPSSAYACGAIGGMALAFWTIARLSPPGWIENWQSGAWGEQATSTALAPLEREGWVVMHDLPAGRGNIDHLVIGPGGVFLLDSKRLSGSVVVEDQEVRVTRFDDPALSYVHPGVGHIIRLARRTHALVLAESRLKLWVTPVMVLWADFPQGVVEDRCSFVSGDELTSWLRARPARLSVDRLPQVAGIVGRALEDW